MKHEQKQNRETCWIVMESNWIYTNLDTYVECTKHITVRNLCLVMEN